MLVVGGVDTLVFASSVVAPVRAEVSAGDDGAKSQDGFGSGRPQRAPVMSSRSAIRWRQAPSTAPVAIGHPLLSAVS